MIFTVTAPIAKEKTYLLRERWMDIDVNRTNDSLSKIANTNGEKVQWIITKHISIYLYIYL